VKSVDNYLGQLQNPFEDRCDSSLQPITFIFKTCLNEIAINIA